jgi:hypothetical protein
LRYPDIDRTDASGRDHLAAVATQARRYLREPADGPWQEVVRALRQALGDSETYDLLHAIEIRFRTSKGP